VRPLALVAALDRGRAIGRAGGMPWHLPDDLKRFKRLTLGKPVLMGRKTAMSIGRALPGRRNLVLTRQAQAPYAHQEIVPSIEAALDLAAGDTLMVIGGGEVYALALPLATHLLLTEIDAQCGDADTFFPHWEPASWRETARAHHAADERHEFAFDFVDYRRREA
jgi:dihydrofolate reductase